ncbi:hypothetical protein AB5J52_42355 [Streptomyces sp. R39]|uniref:Uncharacterized protein n=1 Tax=Streptomyces sp. R39 TaxID=3238631 RepID=A0AB39R1I9_9ACTN
MTDTDDAARQTMIRRGFAPEYATLGWNVIGVAVLTVILPSGPPPGSTGGERQQPC